MTTLNRLTKKLSSMVIKINRRIGGKKLTGAGFTAFFFYFRMTGQIISQTFGNNFSLRNDFYT